MGFMDELRKLTQPYDDEDDFFEGADAQYKPQPQTPAQAQPASREQALFESSFAETPQSQPQPQRRPQQKPQITKPAVKAQAQPTQGDGSLFRPAQAGSRELRRQGVAGHSLFPQDL